MTLRRANPRRRGSGHWAGGHLFMTFAVGGGVWEGAFPKLERLNKGLAALKSNSQAELHKKFEQPFLVHPHSVWTSFMDVPVPWFAEMGFRACQFSRGQWPPSVLPSLDFSPERNLNEKRYRPKDGPPYASHIPEAEGMFNSTGIGKSTNPRFRE